MNAALVRKPPGSWGNFKTSVRLYERRTGLPRKRPSSFDPEGDLLEPLPEAARAHQSTPQDQHRTLCRFWKPGSRCSHLDDTAHRTVRQPRSAETRHWNLVEA